MLQIPADRVAQAGLERGTRRPAERALGSRSVDRVAAIVTGTIGDERLEPVMADRSRLQLVEDVADAVDDLAIGPFVVAADVVFLASPPVLQHLQDAGAMVLDMQPVAHVSAVA